MFNYMQIDIMHNVRVNVHAVLTCMYVPVHAHIAHVHAGGKYMYSTCVSPTSPCTVHVRMYRALNM